MYDSHIVNLGRMEGENMTYTAGLNIALDHAWNRGDVNAMIFIGWLLDRERGMQAQRSKFTKAVEASLFDPNSLFEQTN